MSTDAQPAQAAAADAAALLAERTEIWRLLLVQKRTGLSTSEIYARMAEDAFPLATELGERAMAWHAGEVLDWIAARPRWTPGVEAPDRIAADKDGVATSQFEPATPTASLPGKAAAHRRGLMIVAHRVAQIGSAMPILQLWVDKR